MGPYFFTHLKWIILWNSSITTILINSSSANQNKFLKNPTVMIDGGDIEEVAQNWQRCGSWYSVDEFDETGSTPHKIINE